MEELSPEELDDVMKAPAPKIRRSKKFARDHRTWFYGITKELGNCDNDECKDPRKKKLVYVWTDPNGVRMCRFCFLSDWMVE